MKYLSCSFSIAAAALLATAPGALLAADKPQQDPPPPAALLSKLDPQMAEVVQAVVDSGALPLYQLDAAKARKQPPASAAALAVAKNRGMKVKPQEVGDRDSIKVAGKDEKLDAILYRPVGSTKKDAEPLPVLVYFHGGGFVVADATVYDASARALADAAHCVVISVNYSLAPEYKFPAAPEDAYAAVQYIIKNSAELNIDSKRVAVGGESAGGNLATVVCLMAKDRQGAMPVHQLLVYPVSDWTSTRPSHEAYGLVPVLPEKNLPWFAGMYFSNPADMKKPYASPIFAENFQGLPPATIINAECDVLADDGAAYARKLEEGGVKVTHKVYPGVVHEFFGMGMVVDKAHDAEQFAAGELRKAFASGASVKSE